MEKIKKIDFDNLCNNTSEFHEGVTITIGELYREGWFDLTSSEWDFTRYNDTQHKRLCSKILNHYWDYAVGIMPLSNFKRKFVNTLNEIMPKYIVLYKKIDANDDLFNASSEYYKARNINSDYPQTPLGDNQDYASNGNDRQYEKINDGSILELNEKLKQYDDVDLQIIKELEFLFSALVTIHINSW